MATEKPTPAETPAPSQLDVARFMDNQKPSPVPERPRVRFPESYIAETTPQPAPETLDGLSDELMKQAFSAALLGDVLTGEGWKRMRQVLAPAFAALRREVDENEGVIKIWRRRATEAEQQVETLTAERDDERLARKAYAANWEAALAARQALEQAARLLLKRYDDVQWSACLGGCESDDARTIKGEIGVQVEALRSLLPPPETT